jgi:hypothetical protein
VKMREVRAISRKDSDSSTRVALIENPQRLHARRGSRESMI